MFMLATSRSLKALPGYFEDKYAVRITDVIREESE